MLEYGLRVGSIIQREAIQGADRAGHVQPGKLSHLRGQIDQGRTGLRGTEKIKAARGLPRRIKVDNGPEFISRALDVWAYFNKVKLDYSRPGTPTDNPHIESFNGSFRDECLNMNWFMSLEDARDNIERWRSDYNRFRPHSALTT